MHAVLGMRTLCLPLVAGLFIAGCASDAETRKRRAPGEGLSSEHSYRPGQHSLGGDDREDGIKVEQEQGVLSQGDVDRALEKHQAALVACYDRAGEARKYASGEVNLRFLVSGTGAVSDVLVLESSLGNYPVERCLVVEGRKLALPAPSGGKGTDFDYNLRFRSTGEVSVVEWEENALTKDVSALSPSLGTCGAVGSQEVRARVYIKPGGEVVSAGLSSEGPLEPMAAMCVVEQIRKWKLPDDTGHLVRTSFVVPDAPRAAATPEPKKYSSRRMARRTSRR